MTQTYQTLASRSSQYMAEDKTYLSAGSYAKEHK
jgi:hypothetical protein